MPNEGEGVSEARVDMEQVKQDWLVSNSVVAFVGALLMAWVWEPSEARSTIPFLEVAVPTMPQVVVLGAVAFLAAMSLTLALASAVPPLRSWAIYLTSPYSYLLEILVWFAFSLTLFSALAEIPTNQPWARALWFSGAVLLFFLWGRLMLRPFVAPARWLSRMLLRLVARGWNRFVTLD